MRGSRVILVMGGTLWGACADDAAFTDITRRIDVPSSGVMLGGESASPLGAVAVAPPEACVVHDPVDPSPSTLPDASWAAMAVPDALPRGACLVADDLDRDGVPDLAWAESMNNGANPRLVIRWGRAGSPFGASVSRVSLGSLPGACLPGDHDGNGALDLLLVGEAGAWRVDGLRRRTPTVVQVLDRGPDPLPGPVLSVAEVDLDDDGDLDLIVAAAGALDHCRIAAVDGEADGDVHLAYDNPSPGRVTCVRREAGAFFADDALCPAPLVAHDTVFPFAISLQDLGEDGRPAILVTGDFASNVLLEGHPDGWTDVSASSGLAAYNHAMGVGWLDLDGDGLRDAYITDLGPDQVRRNVGCAMFPDTAWATGVGAATARTVTWAALATDLDRDGLDEVFVTQTAEAFDTLDGGLCDGTAPFDGFAPAFIVAATAGGGLARVDLPDAPAVRGSHAFQPGAAATADLDGDGAEDLVLADPRRGLAILRNTTPAAGPWLGVEPVDARGLPVRGVRVVVETHTGARVRELWPEASTNGWSESVARLGLGAQEGPVVVRVRWPDGQWSRMDGVAPDQVVRVVRP